MKNMWYNIIYHGALVNEAGLNDGVDISVICSLFVPAAQKLGVWLSG